MQFPILSMESGIKFLQVTARINTRKGLLHARREISHTPRISLIEADNEKRAALESIKDMKINQILKKKKGEKTPLQLTTNETPLSQVIFGIT